MGITVVQKSEHALCINSLYFIARRLLTKKLINASLWLLNHDWYKIRWCMNSPFDHLTAANYDYIVVFNPIY